MIALAKMNSEKGKKRILEILQSAHYKSAPKAAAVCEDEEAVREIFECMRKTWEAVCEEASENNLSRLRRFVDVLRNRKEEYIFDFYAGICASKKYGTLEDYTKAEILRAYFPAAGKVYSPEKHYDAFAGMYKSFGAYFDSTWVQGFYEIYPESGERRYPRDKGQRKPAIDKRWIAAFIEKDDHDLVCYAMESDDKNAVEYLVRCIEDGIKNMKSSYFYYWGILELMDIGYKGLDKLVFDLLEKRYERHSGSITYDTICEVAEEHAGKIFSKDYIKKFEALHEKTKNSDFADIVKSLKKHYREG